MFVDLDWPLNASSLLSASAELLVKGGDCEAVWRMNNNKSLINSAALKKLRRAAGICHSVLRNRCAFRCRAKVAVDSDERRRSVGRLFQMSGSETAMFLRPMVVAVRCTLSLPEAADLRCRRPASSTTGWQAQPDTGVLVPADTCWPASQSWIEGDLSRERTNELTFAGVLIYCIVKWNQVVPVCDHSININIFSFIVVSRSCGGVE